MESFKLVVASLSLAQLSPSLFSSIVNFSIRKSAWIKKLILQKLTGVPNNIGVDIFPDPISQLGAILDFSGGSALQVVSECPPHS